MKRKRATKASDSHIFQFVSFDPPPPSSLHSHTKLKGAPFKSYMLRWPCVMFHGLCMRVYALCSGNFYGRRIHWNVRIVRICFVYYINEYHCDEHWLNKMTALGWSRKRGRRWKRGKISTIIRLLFFLVYFIQYMNFIGVFLSLLHNRV